MAGFEEVEVFVMAGTALEYCTIDKSSWERGPWTDEPDKVQWYDEASGLPCLIVRGPVGALCGYVGVRPRHPWHGKGYHGVMLREVAEDEYDPDAYPDVHGGLTFSGPCTHGDDPSKGICHVPAPGDTDDVWWLGFDCAHAGDYTDMKDTAAWRARFSRRDDVYRDVDYVRAECRKLAAQASGMEARSGETGTGSTEGDSPTAAPSGGDAQTPSPSERGSGD